MACLINPHSGPRGGLSGDQEVSGPGLGLSVDQVVSDLGVGLGGAPVNKEVCFSVVTQKVSPPQGLQGESGHPGEEEIHHLAVVSFHLSDQEPKHVTQI